MHTVLVPAPRSSQAAAALGALLTEHLRPSQPRLPPEGGAGSPPGGLTAELGQAGKAHVEAARSVGTVGL